MEKSVMVDVEVPSAASPASAAVPEAPPAVAPIPPRTKTVSVASGDAGGAVSKSYGAARSAPAGPFLHSSRGDGHCAADIGSIHTVHGFIRTVNELVHPQLDALEHRLRAEILRQLPGAGAASSGPAPAPSTVTVYKTPMTIYVALAIALVLSLIALSR